MSAYLYFLGLLEVYVVEEYPFSKSYIGIDSLAKSFLLVKAEPVV